MPGSIILAIDEGTTNAKAIAVNSSGAIIARSSIGLEITHPRPGLAEQDALGVWLAVKQAVENCLAQCPQARVAGVAISNQRESVLIWQRSDGMPLTPIVSWQDRRSESRCQTLRDEGMSVLIAARTGLAIDPMFPAAKLSSMLATLPNGVARAQAGELCVGTIDSWLTWQLTAGAAFVTDYSNAARTQLFNIHTSQWDEHLLALFNVPRPSLAELRDSATLYDIVARDDIQGLPAGTPILSMVGDSHAALYARHFVGGEVIKATYGTGSSLMMSMASPVLSHDGLSTTVAWHDGQLCYAFEGNITHTGSGAAWLGRLLGVSDPQTLTDMAMSVADSQGVYFVPALSGLGAPWWDLTARGMICGLTDAADPAVLARVAFESIAYQIADVFFAMETASGQQLDTLCVDGSASQNDWLMQFQADLLQRVLVRVPTTEVSALGAAALAGKLLGWWSKGDELDALKGGSRIFPHESSHHRMQQNYKGWLEAVSRCRYQPA